VTELALTDAALLRALRLADAYRLALLAALDQLAAAQQTVERQGRQIGEMREQADRMRDDLDWMGRTVFQP
jgi:hypothetical protein